MAEIGGVLIITRGSPRSIVTVSASISALLGTLLVAEEAYSSQE